MKRLPRLAGLVLTAAWLQTSGLAMAQTTPGYPERVLQWTVLPGESCADIATALYGSKIHVALIERYNNVDCSRDGDLPDGVTLVVPEKVTDVAPATVQSLAPDVREKPPGGNWAPATSGMPLYRNHSVNTLDRARADILFVDRSRIVMAAHTLVIIYGTARDSSRTQQSATVELEEGELQAGIMALRGRSPTVAVKGGGEVTANSRDTVLRSQTKRTTVSVFDGSAKVRSAGAAVEVPEKFGTSFVAAQAPAHPRPLPAAPSWTADSDEGVVLANVGEANISTSWSAIDKARTYRLEMAKDPQFHHLVAREEVPRSITAFRAERMPSGSYYLRVRAIDNEDFLGLASPTRSVQVVAISIDGAQGRVDRNVLEVSPYARLEVNADNGLELAIDEDPFGSVPRDIDLTKRPIRRLHWRQRGTDKAVSYQLRYIPVVAQVSVEGTRPSQVVRVHFQGMSEREVRLRVQPRLRVQSSSSSRELKLQPQTGTPGWTAPLPADLTDLRQLEVLDLRGKPLGSLQLDPLVPTPPAASEQREAFETGPCAPWSTSSSAVGVTVWAPTACNTVSLGLAAEGGAGIWAERGILRTSAMLGSFGIEASLQSDLSTSRRAADDAAWLGARWRAITIGRRWSIGPALRLAVPPTADSPSWRVESGWAAAAKFRRFSLLGNLGFRVPALDTRHRSAMPAELVFSTVGFGYDGARWIRGFAFVDAQLIHRYEDSTRGRLGLSVAAETNGRLYVGWALRMSPWQDTGGHLALQLAVGIRD